MASMAFASPIDEFAAERLAYKFMHSFNDDLSVKLSAVPFPAEAKSRESGQASPAFYAFNADSGRGFVLISGDDAFSPVIGYSDHGSFSYSEDMPDGLSRFLDSYSSYVHAVRKGEAVASRHSTSIDGVKFQEVKPMLTTQWNQTEPYNNYCPKQYDIKCPTGCVATALAQVCNFYQYPTQGADEYLRYYVNSDIGYLEARFSDYTIDYSKMKNTYSPNSRKSVYDEVAKLCSMIGIAVRMGYSYSSSGAVADDIITALWKYLAFDPTTLELIYRDYFATQAEFNQLLFNELMGGHPVLFAGFDSDGGGGHEFIVDGVDENGMVHVNWGWGGDFDGYFAVNLMNGAAYEFSRSQNFVHGIHPRKSDGGRVPQVPLVVYRDKLRQISAQKVVPLGEDFVVNPGYIANYCEYEYLWDFGIGLFNKNGEFLENVCVEPDSKTKGVVKSVFKVGLLKDYGNLTCRIPAGYDDGDYMLRCVSKQSGYDEWTTCHVVDGLETSSIPVYISDGKARLNEVSSGILRLSLGMSDDLARVYDGSGKLLMTMPAHAFTPDRLPKKGLFVVKAGDVVKKYVR